MNETELEEIGLQWFSENGWQAVHGPDIAPDSDTPQRSSYNQVLHEQPLCEAIQRINPHLKREEVDEAIHKLRTITHPILVKRNKLFHQILLDGVTVTLVVKVHLRNAVREAPASRARNKSILQLE
ncbi:MAG: type I restriction endonuclease [Balneolaceae bacterium]